MSVDPSHDDTGYIMDAENAAEMARLIRQGRLMTTGMGGLFPQSIDLSSIHDVLDLACGPGEWVTSVATAHTEMQVTGIDISHIMIAYARSQIQEQGISNATFLVGNVREHLPFPDNSFDLVNGRFLFAFMSPTAWSELLQECGRILRPGGTFLLTETESPLTNSLATEKIAALAAEAMKKAGQSFSPDGRHVGITPMLGKFFRDAGYQNIQYKAHVLDCSTGTEVSQEIFHDYVTLYKQIQPYLVKQGVTTQEEIEGVYQRMLEEQQLPNFCELWLYLSVWGQKP